MNVLLSNSNPILTRAIVGLLGFSIAASAAATQPGVRHEGTHAVMSLPDIATQFAADPVDYVNAKPFALPIATNYSPDLARAELIGALASPSVATSGKPAFISGRDGDGKLRSVFLGTPARVNDPGVIAPQEAGTNNHPFSTARADAYTGTTNKTYPFRAAGKLFFMDGTSSFICSASLIGKGLVVTAAHCVNDYGKQHFYSNFRFAPGYKSGAAPYGNWTAKEVRVINSYFNGTDTCSQAGVVCKNDIAVIALNPQGGGFPGTNTGWYGYAVNNAGFTSNNLTHLTQIGYPACLDNGEIMERNDSQGSKSASNANNTLIGSLMCGGSSGGPWILNFGRRPALTSTTSGSSAAENTVFGVTSWGSTSTGPKEQGASPFLTTNIQSLVTAICGTNPAACAP